MGATNPCIAAVEDQFSAALDRARISAKLRNLFLVQSAELLKLFN
jgi:hypothetical protein